MLKKLYFKHIHRHIGTIGVYFILYFLLSNVSLMKSISTYLHNGRDISHYINGSLIFDFSNSLFLIIVMLSFIEAYRQFHYLQERKEIDFVYSLPVSRNWIFLSRYISGILCIIIPFILNMVIGFIIAGVYGASGYVMFHIFLVTLVEFLVFIFCYTFCVLFMIMTGHSLVYWCSLVLFNVIPLILVQVIQLTLISKYKEWKLIAESGDGNPIAYRLLKDIDNFSPAYLVYHFRVAFDSDYDSYGYDFRNHFHQLTEFIPLIVVYTLLLFTVIFLLYKMIRTENCGRVLSFSQLQRPLQIFFTVISGIAIGSLSGYQAEVTYPISYSLNVPFYLLSTLLSIFIIHSMFEILFCGEIKKIFRHKWQLFICTGVTFACSIQPYLYYQRYH